MARKLHVQRNISTTRSERLALGVTAGRESMRDTCWLIRSESIISQCISTLAPPETGFFFSPPLKMARPVVVDGRPVIADMHKTDSPSVHSSY